MSKIYTKTGDKGTTRRPAGESVAEQTVRKDDPLLEAIGTVDELNAAIGLCLATAELEEIRTDLAPLQQELFRLAGLLYAARHPDGSPVSLPSETVDRMERRIDQLTEQLPELTDFILPGGSELAARLHVARTICRRAERRVLTCGGDPGSVPDPCLRYLNRLSDLLFTLARYANKLAGSGDVLWEG